MSTRIQSNWNAGLFISIELQRLIYYELSSFFLVFSMIETASVAMTLLHFLLRDVHRYKL